MLASLLARFGLEAGFKASKTFVIMAMAVLAGCLFWRGMARIDAMNARTERLATAARDAHWTAEIERANAEVSLRQLQDQHMAQQRSAVAEAEITGLKATLSELEKSNAALPNGAGCGLGRDRVRLLNR